MASTDRPEILLLSLSYYEFLDDAFASLLNKLANSARIQRAQNADTAISYLTKSNPRAIIITDNGLTEKTNAEVLEKVLSYIRGGGTAIIGLHFPSFTPMNVVDEFFGFFQLPWKHGCYCRDTFEVNPSCTAPDGVSLSSFPGPYSMKALHISNARPHEKIFIPVNDSMTQSARYIAGADAAVAGAKFGDGYVAYCGDVNGEDGSDRTILALCGLQG